MAAFAVMIVFAVGAFQSCSNDENALMSKLFEATDNKIIELNSSERAAIINSNEFEEYVKASAELASEFQRIESTSQDSLVIKKAKKGVTPSGDYITFPFKIDKNLFKQVELTTAKLLKKYPSFEGLNNENMRVLMKEAFLNKSIYKIFSEKGLFKKKAKNVRRKICIAEGANYMFFNNVSEAYLYASNYAMFHQVEACGYTTENGNVVVYLNPNATDIHSTTPGYQRPTLNGVETGINTYYGSEITGSFQTHLYNAYPSPEDNLAQQGSFKNTQSTILYNGNAYTYYYENGQITNPNGTINNYGW